MAMVAMAEINLDGWGCSSVGGNICTEKQDEAPQ